MTNPSTSAAAVDVDFDNAEEEQVDRGSRRNQTLSLIHI